ncbi:hypothetical protein HanPI659440_Chr00c02g0707751 [Helianthus annuus]|nr:hypothetical protein HanPI659440_Chr00c02g0707751 [Helianthus annuus]
MSVIDQQHEPCCYVLCYIIANMVINLKLVLLCNRLWQEAAGGKVWSLKRTWQQQENWATTREHGSNKINKATNS